MTGDLKTNERVYVGAGAPVTGDEITANTNYGIGSLYVDKTNGAQYVRTGVNKVTGDWTQIGASSSYSVYVSLLSQTGANAPVATAHQNTIGFGSWTRNSAGNYSTTALISSFSADKIWINGLRLEDPAGPPHLSTYYISIFDSGGAYLRGYKIEITNNENGTMTLNLLFANVSGLPVDLSASGAGKLMLPEIRVYT